MNVLIIGSGGREHAIALKISENQDVENIYIAPGNGGTSNVGTNINIQENDVGQLLAFSLEKAINLTIVGPEVPLSLGIVDVFEENNLRIFGPSQKASEIESSKLFSKDLMRRCEVDTARYAAFDDPRNAIEYISKQNYPIVIKADGLAAGKGVYICENLSEATSAVNEILVDRRFGASGQKIVIEEFLEGWEVSVFAFTDGTSSSNLIGACDHKQIGEGNTGPNTGGMGAYSPPSRWTKELMDQINSEIIAPIINGMLKEGNVYKGVLFVGLMITSSGPKVLEFNCRLGDPETQVILPLLQTDLIDIIQHCIDGTLETQEVVWGNKSAVCVVMASGGYPAKYETGFIIGGMETIDPSVEIYHAGTKLNCMKQTITNGGRVLALSAVANSVEEARAKVYRNVDKIDFKNSYVRRDIAKI